MDYLVVRFLEKDSLDDNSFICGLHVDETYDRFVSLIDFLMVSDKEIVLKDNRYAIDDYYLTYKAEEGSLVCLDVIVVGV